jgi:hypothetical protein
VGEVAVPGRARGQFKRLDERQRKALAEYLTARIEYLRAERKYTQQLKDALQAPARGDSKRLRAFASQVLATARGRMRAAQLTAITEAVDIDQLAEMIPTVLDGLRQAVDVPMLLAALNVDIELTGQAVTKATPLIERITASISSNRRSET